MRRPCLTISGAHAWRICIGVYLAGIAASSSAEIPTEPNAADFGNPVSYKKMSLEELMSLDVTSVSKEPEPYGEAPAAIDVITHDEITRSGATSIPEALELADNLQVAQKSPHDWAISARGFNTDLSNKLLVLTDGRAVYSPLFSGVSWDVQDYLLQDIDRIEVVSGPGGTLWGANAVNGVINITTKSARETQGGYLEAGGGEELKDFAAMRYGTTLGPNTYIRIYGKYFNKDSGVTADGKDAENGWNMGQGGFRMDSYPSPGNTFTLQGDGYSGTEDVVAAGTGKVNGENLLGHWAHVVSEDSDMSLKLYYDRTHLLDPIPASAFAGKGFLTDDLDTYDIEFQDRFRVDDHNEIVWGLGYRLTDDALINAPALGFYPAQLDQNLFSGFTQDEIKLGKNTTFTLGSKLEHNDYTGLEVEPSARIKWDFALNQMLWSAISRAVRTPSRVDRDISEPSSPPAILVGESSYSSETLIAYELGYRAQLGPKVSSSISAFYNTYDHVRSLSFTPATILPLFFQNNLEGHTYGVELNATYQILDWWRLKGGYNLLREHIQVKPGQVDLNHALNETADPENQFSIQSSMDLPGRLQLDARLRWVDSFTINNGGVAAIAPSYSELNARLAWQATQTLELSVTAQNLLHRLHVEYGVPGPQQQEIGRTIYGKVAWHF